MNHSIHLNNDSKITVTKYENNNGLGGKTEPCAVVVHAVLNPKFRHAQNATKFSNSAFSLAAYFQSLVDASVRN